MIKQFILQQIKAEVIIQEETHILLAFDEQMIENVIMLGKTERSRRKRQQTKMMDWIEKVVGMGYGSVSQPWSL